MFKHVKRALVATALVGAMSAGMSGSAWAVGGGQFCSAGSGTSGGYACVELQGYNRWLKIA